MEPETEVERKELYSSGQGEYRKDLLPSVSPDQESTVFVEAGETVTVPVRMVMVYMETDGDTVISDSGGTTIATVPQPAGNSRYVPLRDGGIVVVPAEGEVDASAVTTGMIRLVPIEE